MKYRIGIDLGTHSLGWAAIMLKDMEKGGALRPGPLLDMGVRIFSDSRNPKDKSSNAAQRRGPRGTRRNRDRKLMRKAAMLRALTDYGLMPASVSDQKVLEAEDPWILRARALDEKLTPHQVGRAIFHLQQRRGFKSNRKTDGEGDGAMLDAIKDVKSRLFTEDARTLGELLGRERLRQAQENSKSARGTRKPLPQARVKANANGNKIVYDHFPDRALILDEFEAIWTAQEPHHACMTEEAKDAFRRIIEFQRPLKAQRAGKCIFLQEEPRAPKALPTAQYARILQEVNHLSVGTRGEVFRVLTPDERASLIEYLRLPSSKSAKRSFKGIRETLNLPDSLIFNLETRKRDHLVGDLTAARMMQDDAWGLTWYDLPRAEQDAVVTMLLETQEEADVIVWLGKHFNMTKDKAQALSRINLPSSFGKLSKTALDRIIPHMEVGSRYDAATSHEFGDHRAHGTGEIFDEVLPYYGEILNRHTTFERDHPENDEERFGRVANPTVHVALNELRKVMNDLMKRYGAPEQVVLELARDLPLSDRGLRELENQQRKNQDINDERRRTLEALKQKDNYENRLKLRLYEEALESFGGKAICVFTGEPISKTELFSDKVEIQHILPLSKTLDDSFSNKILSRRRANQIKGNRAPYDAFAHNPEGFNWEQISLRAGNLHDTKGRRFDPDAMEKWEERGGDFLTRQLYDTRYIARLAKAFVEAIFDGQGNLGQSQQVWVIPGRLTSDLRHYAGFNHLRGLSGSNRKDRTDHRHHAIDALVIALTDHTLVKRASDLVQGEDSLEHSDIIQAMAEPLKRYRNEAEDRLSKLIVSHKPDHGFQDAMHNDTAYGLTDYRDTKGQRILVTRRPLESFTTAKQLEAIVDPVLRNTFQSATEGLSSQDFTQELLKAAATIHPQGVNSVRIHTPMKDSSFLTITHGTDGTHRKAYKGNGNYCYDIFMGHKGKWTGEIITTFEAYQMAQTDRDWWQKHVGRAGQKLIMRIRKGDMLEVDFNGIRRVVTVFKFSHRAINMAEHHEANASSRVRSKDLIRMQMSPTSLQKNNAIALSVSPTGKVRRHWA